MKRIALTGSIGTGKSTILKMFRKLGIPTWDADSAVHKLYRNGGRAYEILGQEFGDIILDEKEINREALGKLVLNNPIALKKLESIIHPLVAQNRQEFYNEVEPTNPPYVLVDIPLLFETKSESQFDKVIVVNCDFETQKQRVMLRPNMTEEKFLSILAKQMPSDEKTARADFVINSSKSIEETKRKVRQIDRALRG
jgi:dephospho-CoA kinase